MMNIQNTIDIQAPISEVFAFVADMRNTPQWNYFVTEVIQESGDGPAVGVSYHQTRQTDEQRYEITTFEPGQQVIVESRPGSSMRFTRRLRFEPLVNGTRLIDQMSLQTRYPAILERLAVGRVRAAVGENLGKLKELLEDGQTRLQDGRIVQKYVER